MRFYPAVILFAAASLWCVAAGPAPETSALSYENTKCSRLFPWTEGEWVSKCTYFCKGWPIRRENEPDGISCKGVRPGVCLHGKCVDADEFIPAE